MSTDIAYLQDLRADLMTAATQATSVAPGRRAAPTRAPRVPRPIARWKLASGLVASFVVVAGVVGYLANGGTEGGRQLADGSAEVLPAGGRHGLAGVPGGTPAPGLSRTIDEQRSRNGVTLGSFFGLPHTAATPAPSAVPRAAPGGSVDGVPAVGPNIIKTGEIQVQVERHTFVGQFQKAMAIAERYGGYVQTSSTSGTRTHSGTMTIRVPADKFSFAVTDLRLLGRVLHQEVTGQDVTAQFVDLGARLKNAEVQEARLRKLLSTAPSVGATLSVNRVLSQTELLIEELQGQLRVLQNRSDLGTIHLAMEEKPPKITQAAPPPTEPPVKNPKLGRALDKGVAGFLGVVFSVVVGIGYLLPLLVVGLIAWVVVRRVRRSRMATA